jgi:ketosteroid isomerase-like protein
MKNIITLFIFGCLLTSCAEKNKYPIDDQPMSGYMLDEDIYTAMVDKFMKAYADNDMESTKDIFSEDAVYYVNDVSLSVSELIAAFGEGHTYYDDIAHSDVYTATMYYNDGNIYTNVWYNWRGVLKSNGEALSLKGYAWFKWKDGKAVEAYNAFDPTAYNTAIAIE